MNRKDAINLYNYLLVMSYWNDWSLTIPFKDFLSAWTVFRRENGYPKYDQGKAEMVNGFFVYDGKPVVRIEPPVPKVSYNARAEYYEGKVLAKHGL